MTIDELDRKTQAGFMAVQTEFAAVRAEMKTEFAAVRAELRTEITASAASVTDTLRAEIAASAASVTSSVTNTLRAEIAASAASVTTSVTNTLRAEIKAEGEITCRHFDVVAEQFKDWTRLLADGTARNRERLDNHETRLAAIESERPLR